MRNEALAKILCHNLCVLISAWYELGIEPSDWAAQKLPNLHKNPGDLHIYQTGNEG